MPPRTRGKGNLKNLKENNEVVQKNTVKCGKVTKPARKALSDKTNSASDDNLIAVPTNRKKSISTGVSKVVVQGESARPRRDRRLPTRFVANILLTNLSNNKESTVIPISQNVEIESPAKNGKSESSSFKTPAKLEDSIVITRPRRICRLTSRLEDHAISDNKFSPVQPCHASTPIQQNKVNKIASSNNNKCTIKDKPVKKTTAEKTKPFVKKVAFQKQVEKPKEKSSPDTNNNPKRILRKQPKKKVAKPSPIKISSLSSNIKKGGKRFLENNLSFKVLEDKKQSPSNDKSNIDIYEFTFDPAEEPPPQKKKRKRVVKKKPTKPKMFVFKSNYDQNLSKALNALKNIVTKKQPQLQNLESTKKVNEKGVGNLVIGNGITNIVKENLSKEIPNAAARETIPAKITSNPVENTVVNNHTSIQIEDIAADFEPVEDDHHEAINYSPVNSPNRPGTPNVECLSPVRPSQNKDPLNLQGDASFFDEQPVASSSMNVSVRHPLASPWRVEFGSLPIKWQSNTYVKSNMTPAIESSFINFDDSNKKKHVYTNLLPDTNEGIPQTVANDKSNLTQPSIISFIKEIAERSANKRKRERSVTPSKVNSLFEDHVDIRTPKKIATKNPNKPTTPNKSGESISNYSTDTSNENQNSNTTDGSKVAKQKADKDKTYFGFDDSENLDQENVSPVKVNPKVRALRPRSRAVLHEINAQSGPMRAALPLAAKTKLASADAVNKVYEQLKGADAPIFPEKNTGVVTTNIDDQSFNEHEDGDDESVHLFEDIELIYHLKPTRKSYGKAKKVTFRQTSSSNEDRETVAETQGEICEEDDLADLSFHVPTIMEKNIVAKKKRSNKRNKISKKEKKEVDEWAAGFNSMCEEIDDFPLMVE